MIKKIIVIIIFLGIGSFAFADNSKTFEEYRSDFAHHEVYANYGYPQSGLTYLMTLFTGTVSIIGTQGQSTLKATGPGTFHCGYNWYILDWLAIGGTAGIELYNLKEISPSGTEKSDFSSGYFTTIQGKVTFSYGNDWVQGYHGISAGLLLGGLDNSEPPLATMALNVTIAGLKIGSQKGGINGFFEIGFGTSSLINAGIGYRF